MAHSLLNECARDTRLFPSVAAGKTVPLDSTCERDWGSACPDGDFVGASLHPFISSASQICYGRLVDIGKPTMRGSIELCRFEKTNARIMFHVISCPTQLRQWLHDQAVARLSRALSTCPPLRNTSSRLHAARRGRALVNAQHVKWRISSAWCWGVFFGRGVRTWPKL